MEIEYHAQPIDEDMRCCIRLKRELAFGGQVQDDENRTNEEIGEHAQAIRAWERSLHAQEDNDRRQEHALSDGGREDLFDIYEDDASLEYMRSDSD